MANLRAKDFGFGAPKTVAFKAPGVTAASSIGDPQVKFAMASGDVLYLDEGPAGDIERGLRELGIQYGEEFRLTRAKTSHGGSRFEVARLRDSGGHNVPERQQRSAPSNDAYDQRFDEPAPSSRAEWEARQRGPAPVATVQPVRPTSAKLSGTVCAMLDAMNEAAVYAERIGLGITSEDLRALIITAFIDNAKGGR
jgi:hypothetical protein